MCLEQMLFWFYKPNNYRKVQSSVTQNDLLFITLFLPCVVSTFIKTMFNSIHGGD